MYWSLATGSSATITRNSKVLHTLTLSGKLEFYGFTDNRENSSDIVVLITPNAGTVIVQTSKVDGYGSQQHQDQGALG